MPRRDPLQVLARLRGLERDAARRALAEADSTRAAAAARRDAAIAALSAEAGAAPGDYAAWLPAATQALGRAEAETRRADAGAEAARKELVAARADAEAVEALLLARRVARRRARLAADQALLDDLRR